MRLDHFLPALTKVKDRAFRRPRWPARVARRVFPASWLSDSQPRRVGGVRRWLQRLGPTWLSSPLRRIIQTVCLSLFLWFFFARCWPYSAQPLPVWKGWIPVEIDAETGRVRITSENELTGSLQAGAHVHICDQQTGNQTPAYLGSFVVERAIGRRELYLRPQETMTPGALEQLSISAGPWTLSAQPPNKWPSHYADQFATLDKIPVETFLLLDPLVSISTALAARAWIWSLWGAAIILGVCVFIPRGFCGYVCPLGTVIDLFDWAIGKRVKRFNVPDDGWWVHFKYYLLLGVLVAALGGVLLSGFVSAIPVLTRGLLFLLAPLQLGFVRGWHQVPAMNSGQLLSILLFAAVLCLGFLRSRFWCKYVCPSGAVFSLGNLFRTTERKVEDSCIHCNKCVEICPFDAIKPDFTTRVTDCTLCQTCGGVCPTHAIKFVDRNNHAFLKLENEPPTGESRIGRRGFLGSGLGVLAGLTGGVGSGLVTKTLGARLDDPAQWRPVRPPGSVPEQEFLELCIRCGECFKVCPNNVLQPLGFQQGLEGLWTPHAVANWAGCEPSCNSCGGACPTGAIRAIPLEEKKVARMGLAVVNAATCLPWAGKEACQLCVDECVAAGYDAIEFVRVHTLDDSSGKPPEGAGFLAPKVQPDKCVGCGLCQTRCYSINVKTKKSLQQSAIIVEAGNGKEDRMMSGSYVTLREKTRRETPRATGADAPAEYLPEFLKRGPSHVEK